MEKIIHLKTVRFCMIVSSLKITWEMLADMSSEFVSSACPHDCPSTCALEVERLDDHTIGKVRGAADAQAADSRIVPATDEDWDTEYLDSIISVKVVDGVEDAIDHIERHGTNHTDSIITGNAEAAETFVKKVDSAIVLVNASTQFADGGEFGMGAEIGISTGKLHARGPVGVDQLTTFKYVVRGTGQTR